MTSRPKTIELPTGSNARHCVLRLVRQRKVGETVCREELIPREVTPRQKRTATNALNMALMQLVADGILMRPDNRGEHVQYDFSPKRWRIRSLPNAELWNGERPKPSTDKTDGK